MARTVIVEEANPNVGNDRGFVREAPNINANFVELYGSPITALTAAATLTAADSGTTYTLGTAGGFNVTLPAPASGLRFAFIVKVAPTTAYTITTNGTTQNVIHGLTVNGENSVATNSDSTSGTPVDVITFAANKAQIGDRVDMVCDGTLWYARAYATQQDAITFD